LGNLKGGVVSQKSFRVEPFEPKSASKALWDAYFEFDRSLFKETCPDPDEEPISSKIMKRFMADPDPFRQHVYWMVLGEDKAQVIGFAQVGFVLEKAPNYRRTNTSRVALSASLKVTATEGWARSCSKPSWAKRSTKT